MPTNSETTAETMTEAGEILADLSASMGDAAEEFAAFDAATDNLSAARPRSEEFPAADD
jgi:hypothetical protein